MKYINQSKKVFLAQDVLEKSSRKLQSYKTRSKKNKAKTKRETC